MLGWVRLAGGGHGYLFLFVHDSDGNWLEGSAELPTVAPGRPGGT
jgi:hypothetical protein